MKSSLFLELASDHLRETQREQAFQNLNKKSNQNTQTHQKETNTENSLLNGYSFG